MLLGAIVAFTTRKMSISDQEFLTDPKSPLKKSYLWWQNRVLANNMEGKFPSKILVFVMGITHNCDSFSSWSQIFHILSSIYEGFILPLQIRFFERAFWVRQKFLVANRHFSCSEKRKIVQMLWAKGIAICSFSVDCSVEF